MTRPLRVLHLEDNPRDAELVRHRLEVEGVPCDIHLANGQVSFESALAQKSFDLIISDYNLNGYDGITALRQAQATQPDVPVILVSGTVSEEQAVRRPSLVRDGGRRLDVMQKALPQLHPCHRYPCDLIIHVHVLG